MSAAATARLSVSHRLSVPVSTAIFPPCLSAPAFIQALLISATSSAKHKFILRSATCLKATHSKHLCDDSAPSEPTTVTVRYVKSVFRTEQPP